MEKLARRRRFLRASAAAALALSLGGGLLGLGGALLCCSGRDAPPRSRAAPSELERRFDALLRLDRESMPLPPARRFAAVAAEYQRWFAAAASQPMAALSDGDVEVMFRAAEMMASYFPGPAHVRTVAAAAEQLERRGKAEARHYQHLAQTYLVARQLEQARQLRARHPEAKIDPVPVIREASEAAPGQPGVWRLAHDSTAAAPILERHGVDVHRDAQVLVVANPFCHFALAAVAALDADAELGPLLAARSTWITPQDGFFAVAEAEAWNRAHPRLPIAFSVRRDEWPLVDDWATPTFYFLRRGELVAKVSGWPKEGRRAELSAALAQIGLR